MFVRGVVICVLVFCSTYGNGDVVDMSWDFKANVTAWWPNVLFRPYRFDGEFRGHFPAPNGNTIWVEAENYTAASHGGTHMDAPSHISASKEVRSTVWTLEQIPVHRMMGPLRVVNVKAKAAQNRDYQVTVSDITEHERKYGVIPRGSIVLMNSGWSLKLPDVEAYWGVGYLQEQLSFPAYSKEAAQYLVNRGINGAGVDTPSLDYGKMHTDFPAHRTFFKANIFGLEHLMNLDKVPETGATLFAFPMKLAGSSGGPCRVVAVWGDERASISGAFGAKMSILLVLVGVGFNLVCNNLRL